MISCVIEENTGPVYSLPVGFSASLRKPSDFEQIRKYCLAVRYCQTLQVCQESPKAYRALE
jgi:hypothetical protein